MCFDWFGLTHYIHICIHLWSAGKSGSSHSVPSGTATWLMLPDQSWRKACFFAEHSCVVGVGKNGCLQNVPSCERTGLASGDDDICKSYAPIGRDTKASSHRLVEDGNPLLPLPPRLWFQCQVVTFSRSVSSSTIRPPCS